MSDIKYQISSIKYQVSDIKYQISSIRYQVSYIKYHISSIRYQVPGIKYRISSIGYQVSGLKYSVVGTWMHGESRECKLLLFETFWILNQSMNHTGYRGAFAPKNRILTCRSRACYVSAGQKHGNGL